MTTMNRGLIAGVLLAHLFCSAASAQTNAEKSGTSKIASSQSKSSLFSSGAEVFAIKDKGGKTPIFKILNGSSSERMMAMALIAAINADPNVQPKIDIEKPLELKAEQLTLEPSKDDASKLGISLRVSGYQLELSKTVNRADFLAGKPMDVKFPTESKNVSLFQVNSQGELKFRYEPKTQGIVIENAMAQVRLQSQFAGQGEEKIRFSGTGTRVTGKPEATKKNL